MANSDAGTSSNDARRGEYQVFLSFRGPDTRKGFTSFLRQDLDDNCIRVFIDDGELRVGEEIGGDLMRAIDNSQIYIPIFSENYAGSKWCLRELARMVDNTSISKGKKQILPIFYDVKPDDVKLKTSSYTKFIDEHKKEFPHEVESWEEALMKVAQIKGWELSKCESEEELMKLVVREVLHRLKKRYKFVTEHLVGLDGPVDEVLKLLDVNCSDVRLFGIHGMGGIGKSTLAKVIFNKLSSHFGGCCAFLDDIRENSKKHGLVELQKKLIREIVSPRAADIIDDVDYGRMRIEETQGNKKVLIVLDDIDEKEQIENLIGRDPLHPGSRIIITTRDTRVLKIREGILAYEMKEMNFVHALQLFNSHAFLEGSLAKDFDGLSRDIVSTTGKLPLALEILGSLLCGRNEAIWKETLDKLRDIPDENVQKKLMISYDALNEHQRKLFLDAACFFINEDMTNAFCMWTDCNFYPHTGIDVLVSMSLIKKMDDNKLWMHDQLRDLGRKIVRQESPTNLAKRSRLWIREEVLELLRTKKRKKKVEGLDLQGRSSHILISHEQIQSFESLRFLRLSNGTFIGDFTDCLPKLRWISWSSPPPDFSATNIHLKNLVILELSGNHFTDDSKVWNLIKMASKLKILALVECHRMNRTPDLSGCLTLERLTVDHCERLKEIDSSIGKVKHLLYLNITHCWRLESLPEEIGELVKLERFSLKGCYKVRKLPSSIGNLASLKELDLSRTGIASLPDSIGKLRCLLDLNLHRSGVTELPSTIEGLAELQYLGLKDTKIRLRTSIGKLKSLCTLELSCEGIESDKDRWELPRAIGDLEKLEGLYLRGRLELEGEIPPEIGRLSHLKVLDLCRTRICHVPSTINKLSCLSTLDLRSCDEIEELPELPASIVILRVKSCSLQVVPNLSDLSNLEELILSDGTEEGILPYGSECRLRTCDLRWIGRLSKLKKLELCLLNIVAPPMELGHLSLLENLILHRLDLQALKQLPPSLSYLTLDKFNSKESQLSNLKFLSSLTLRFSELQEIQLNELLHLQSLSLTNCVLERLSIPSGLRTLSVSNCFKLMEITGMLESLEELSIDSCYSIERLGCDEIGSLGVLGQSESSSSAPSRFVPEILLLTDALKKLRRLKMSCCIYLVEIRVVGTLLSLQDVCIRYCDGMEKFSISPLKNLQRLVVCNCPKLRVVEGLDELEFLINLRFSSCPSLETSLNISNSKMQDKCLIKFDHCGESLDTADHITFRRYKKMVRRQRDQNPNP